MTNPLLAQSIKKAEDIREHLSGIIAQMHRTQADLSPEAVDTLADTVHEFMNNRGQVSFRFEIEFDAIQDDLFE